MEVITKEQEETIDAAGKKYGEICFKRDDDIIIPAKDIYLYGSVNLNSDDDLDYIFNFDLIPPDGGIMFSNFDYDKGCYTTVGDIPKTCITFDAIEWFKYNYVLLGKPKRIIIYKLNKK